jgi:hypothetical protein
VNGPFDVLKRLEINQPRDTMPLCETFSDFQSVFRDAAYEIVRDANVKGSADAAGEDVDVLLA